MDATVKKINFNMFFLYLNMYLKKNHSRLYRVGGWFGPEINTCTHREGYNGSKRAGEMSIDVTIANKLFG